MIGEKLPPEIRILTMPQVLWRMITRCIFGKHNWQYFYSEFYECEWKICAICARERKAGPR